MKHLIFLLVLISPFAAQAKVACEDLSQIIDVPDDQCGAIEDSARRCFSALNKAYADTRHVKDKAERDRARSEVARDYEREIANWKQHFVYLSRLGEGRACTDETGSVGVWIEEMEKDLKALRGRR